MVTHALTVLAFVSNPLIANAMEKLATTIFVEVLPLVRVFEVPSCTSLRRSIIEKCNIIKIKFAAPVLVSIAPWVPPVCTKKG